VDRIRIIIRSAPPELFRQRYGGTEAPRLHFGSPTMETTGKQGTVYFLSAEKQWRFKIRAGGK
jgi:hypothetical protein